ncbi:hypothetical protein O7635_29465 [Asanoa sp. WMMD1127]|uniref:hypothetical protein n=1 Tax=Asanoa sp. WMMD1127 TaxID=3016107 RepID=UPI002417B0AB|nr:hypothetical protein [Asanoa sp. WMMD1127]MDG4825998.1 hypothetical protein [Asanoa sp. WMMD1127]
METNVKDTREAWLHRAVEIFRAKFIEIGTPLPETIHVSVGFAAGARAENGKILGCTYKRELSEDGNSHVFISPESGDTVEVLETLLHELIHVADNCESGHKKFFAEAATRLGFLGPATMTPASPTLMAELVLIIDSLGHYPHSAMTLPTRVTAANIPGVLVGASGGPIKWSSGPAKQGTRMLKMVCDNSECPAHGYTVRLSAKWIAIGAPRCPMGHEMTAA